MFHFLKPVVPSMGSFSTKSTKKIAALPILWNIGGVQRDGQEGALICVRLETGLLAVLSASGYFPGFRGSGQMISGQRVSKRVSKLSPPLVDTSYETDKRGDQVGARRLDGICRCEVTRRRTRSAPPTLQINVTTDLSRSWPCKLRDEIGAKFRSCLSFKLVSCKDMLNLPRQTDACFGCIRRPKTMGITHSEIAALNFLCPDIESLYAFVIHVAMKLAGVGAGTELCVLGRENGAKKSHFQPLVFVVSAEHKERVTKRMARNKLFLEFTAPVKAITTCVTFVQGAASEISDPVRLLGRCVCRRQTSHSSLTCTK